jgi:Spy/CpxP family protein refolding chaperone
MKTLCLAVIVLSAAAAYAQDAPPQGGRDGGGPEHRMMRMAPPPFDWWRNSEVAQKLNLTDQQKQQLEQVFTQAKLQLVDLKGAVEKEEIKLQSLMNADPMQENLVLAQIENVQAARSKLGKNFALMALNFRKILSAEQWKLLQQQDIVRFHRRHEGGSGREMPPPSGAPPSND